MESIMFNKNMFTALPYFIQSARRPWALAASDGVNHFLFLNFAGSLVRIGEGQVVVRFVAWIVSITIHEGLV